MQTIVHDEHAPSQIHVQIHARRHMGTKRSKEAAGTLPSVLDEPSFGAVGISLDIVLELVLTGRVGKCDLLDPVSARVVAPILQTQAERTANASESIAYLTVHGHSCVMNR